MTSSRWRQTIAAFLIKPFRSEIETIVREVQREQQVRTEVEIRPMPVGDDFLRRYSTPSLLSPTRDF